MRADVLTGMTPTQLCSNPMNPSATDLAREACYVCHSDGYTAIRTNSPEAAAELVAKCGFVPVTFKAVKLRPPVCPVNGAEFGDEPYYARLPHRPDGQRITYR